MSDKALADTLASEMAYAEKHGFLRSTIFLSREDTDLLVAALRRSPEGGDAESMRGGTQGAPSGTGSRLRPSSSVSALSGVDPSRIPPGWKLVPEKFTDEMSSCYWGTGIVPLFERGATEDFDYAVERLWEALLAAAPPAPGIETGTATTEGRGAEHESLVGSAEAPDAGRSALAQVDRGRET